MRASLEGRARGCASAVSMRVILSHLGSPDNLAFMYSPIVLTLTEGFARGGAHVVYGSTGERNGTRDRWTQQTLSDELCAALIAGQSPRSIHPGVPPHHVHPSTCGALLRIRLLLRHGDAFVWLGHLLYLLHQGTLTTTEALLRALAALRPNGVAFVLYMTEPQSSTDDQCQLLTCPPRMVPMLSEVMYSTALVRVRTQRTRTHNYPSPPPPPPPLPPLPPLPTHTHTQNITTPNQLWDYSRKNTDQCGGTASMYTWRPLNIAANPHPLPHH